MSILILKNGKRLEYKDFIFPGGEIGFKLNSGDNRYKWDKAEYQTVTARLSNSADFIRLAMAKDALEKFDKTPVKLFIPYLPYARQDRVCDKGEAFSLKVFSNLLNSLNFTEVTICDPHSEVAPALINNVNVITQFDIINKWLDFTNRIRDCVLVAPDAGAAKKTAQIAKYLDHSDYVRADKLRDLTNGKIKETIVYCDDFKGRDILCADDIIDGGRTFIELARICKAKNCGKFILYATHGIFSAGVKNLFNGGIDEIWTTNSFPFITEPDSISYYEKIKVFNLESKFI